MMRYFREVLFVTVTVIFIITGCTPSKEYLIQKSRTDLGNAQKISVLVLTTSDDIRISSENRLKLTLKKTGRVFRDIEKGSITLKTEEIEEPLIAESWKGPLCINGTPYRGAMEIHNVLSRIHVINCLSIEEYLCSVVASEIPASWPAESLKAQAVAARTYAMYHLNHNTGKKLYDLDATTNFQVYKGAGAERPETTEAVLKTRGEVIMSDHQPVLSYFHSSCGGKTTDDKYVWTGEDFPYLKGVQCGYCGKSPDSEWECYLNLGEIKTALKRKYNGIGSIESVTFQKQSGRVTKVVIYHGQGKLVIPGNEFRLLFPAKTVRSLYFTSCTKGDGILLKGKGWGHGGGLCQWGARGMAEKGASYRAILNYYYRGVSVTRINTGHIASLN